MRVDVDVQFYVFIIKFLFVGYMDYKYLCWQVVDIFGILDYFLEDRNIIEMQVIIVLVYFCVVVLYVMDLFEQCGYGLREQLEFFQNIRFFFINKFFIVVVNKCDVKRIVEFFEDDQKIFIDLQFEGFFVIEISILIEEGVIKVKIEVCDRFLVY